MNTLRLLPLAALSLLSAQALADDNTPATTPPPADTSSAAAAPADASAATPPADASAGAPAAASSDASAGAPPADARPAALGCARECPFDFRVPADRYPRLPRPDGRGFHHAGPRSAHRLRRCPGAGQADHAAPGGGIRRRLPLLQGQADHHAGHRPAVRPAGDLPQRDHWQRQPEHLQLRLGCQRLPVASQQRHLRPR